MDFPTLLTNLTLIVVALIVAALVIYLVGIIIALRRAGDHLEKLAGELQKITNDTSPLNGHVTTINGALKQLCAGLGSVDGHLAGITKIWHWFRLIQRA